MTWEIYCEEIRPYWLIATKGYGFTVHDIDWSCPSDLEPYAKAHKREVIVQDTLMHAWWGAYGLSAVSVAVEHCLAGKKAVSEYTKNPIMRDLEERENGNSESNEEVAVYEMKQRINLLRQSGLPESPR